MLLGCIGDDFTGSSDLANTLVKNGMRTTQYCGLPQADAGADVEAGVVALKTRSIPVEEAVRQSLEALEWLQRQGCTQFLFKYCSTFDSTPDGNIGPVAEALADRLGARKVIVCPAFPGAGRTLYQGHLFVQDRLLSESGMENHPLTPMTDPDIRRWLGLQAKGSVGHLAYGHVAGGAETIAAALTREDQAGHRLVVVDALTDDDLTAIGAAAHDIPLLTGGSGIATGLPGNFRQRGLLADAREAWEGVDGPAVVLSGSCSNATRRQVERYRQAHPSFEVTADAVMASSVDVDALVHFVEKHRDAVPLVYSSADPATVKTAQSRYGTEPLAHAIETLFSDLAGALAATGFTRIVSAGGETSGAVVRGLGIEALQIGPEIDPGVPAMRVTGKPLAVALKSGNFGADNFFDKAVTALGAQA
jgi:3-dehydrotetronate 4-kinase